MKIDDADFHVRGNLGEHPIGRGERAIDRPHEDAAEEADDGHFCAVGGGNDTPGLARRGGRKIGRLHDVVGRVQDAGDLAAAVNMVAECDAIDAGRDELAIDAGGEARAIRGVFRVGDDQIEAFSFAQARQRPGDDFFTRFADDVAD
jgi:hypothetical protein